MADIKKTANKVRSKLKGESVLRECQWNAYHHNLSLIPKQSSNRISSMKSRRTNHRQTCGYARRNIRHCRVNLSRSWRNTTARRPTTANDAKGASNASWKSVRTHTHTRTHSELRPNSLASCFAVGGICFLFVSLFVISQPDVRRPTKSSKKCWSRAILPSSLKA